MTLQSTEYKFEIFEERWLIRYRLQNERVVEFWVAEIAGISGSEITFRDSNDEVTTSFNKAEQCLSGSIKWDGCSNWNYNTENCRAHFCGRKNAVSFSNVMDRMYEITKINLPTYCLELAEK